MVKKIYLILLFITVLYFSSTTNAEVASITITDFLIENNGLNEVINIQLINNKDSNFSFTLPTDAINIYVDNTKYDNNMLIVPLNCTACNFEIKYDLISVVREQKEIYTFSRTLNFPIIPKQLKYSIRIPPGYIISDSSQEPSIVPEGELLTNGRNIIIQWEENNPELPKRYFIKYIEFKSKTNLLISAMLLTFLIGAILGYYGFIYHHKKFGVKSEIVISQIVPKSLLSPDECKIIELLNKNKKQMNQRAIVKELEWSKSKVSAILTNLDYKKIIEREKIGRNYTVKLVKEIQ